MGIDKELNEDIFDIDTFWKSSWHWKRDKWGNLTREGWEQVLYDAKRQFKIAETRSEEMKKLIQRIKIRVACYDGEEE